MKKISNLTELLSDRLNKLYTSEQLQFSALKELASRAGNRSLQNNIDSYQQIKIHNIERLDKSFKALGVSKRLEKCSIVEDMVSDCRSLVSESAKKNVADAALITTIQQINHFNIANYGSAASFASTLDEDYVGSLLHEALEDEKNTDRKLTEIAEEVINPAAVTA